MIKDTPTITYHGSYAGLAGLPIDDYDLFLLTSNNEGMPNVILKAIMAQIFIVAPAVSGIPECLKDRKNGIVVHEKYNPEAYTAAIIEAYDQNLFSDRTAIKDLSRRIIKQHSNENYQAQVKNLMGL